MWCMINEKTGFGSRRWPSWLLANRIRYRHFTDAPKPKPFERCAASNLARLTIVQAPAGFGKTTLLAHLAAAAANRGAAVSWFSADSSDDLTTACTYLSFALLEAGLNAEPPRANHILSESEASRLIATALNAVERDGRAWSLFIDDVDQPSAMVCQSLFSQAIRFAPPNLRIVLSCRADPGLDTLQMEANGTLLSIGPEDLRLEPTDIETSCLADREHAAFFFQHTAGWPAALGILRSKLREVAAPNRAVLKDALDAASAQFSKHFTTALCAEEREFLQCALLAGAIYPEQIEAFGGSIDRARVRELSRSANLFCLAEKETREAYVVHPLVKRRWEQKSVFAESSIQANFCRSAAEWKYRAGNRFEPIALAMAARDKALAISYFERIGGLTIYFSEGIDFLRGIMAVLDDGLPPVSPRFLLAKSLLAMKGGELAEARHYHGLATCEQEASREVLDPRFKVESELLNLVYSQYSSSPNIEDLTSERVQQLLKTSLHDPALRGYVAMVQCVAHLQAGHFELCRHFGEIALDSAKRCRSHYEALHVHYHLAVERMSLGLIEAALDHLNQAAELWRLHFPDDKDVEFRHNILMGALYWESGEFDVARKFIRSMLEVRKRVDISFDMRMMAYRLAADYLLHCEGPKAATRYLKQARELLENEPLAREIAFIDNLIAIGQIEHGAADTAQEAEEATLTWREQEVRLQLRLRLSSFTDDIPAAIAAASTMLALAERTGNIRMQIRALIELAVVERGLAPEAAGNHLISAAALAQSTGYVWPLVEHCAALDDLFVSAGRNEPVVARLHRSLRRITHKVPARQSEEVRLSRRQREVLAELCNGRTDKQIARALRLTPNGVRYHLKALYATLGVRGRTQAVRSAEQLDLLGGPAATVRPPISG